MGIRIQITGFNPSATANRILNDGVKLAIAQSVTKAMFDYVPADTETLAEKGIAKIENGEAFVLYTTPYSKRQYYGEHFNFNTEKHPNASAYWDKTMMRARKRQIVRTAQRIISRG